MSLFNRTVEWFVPAGLAERAPEEHRRARLSVVLLLALFPMNPVAAATYAMLGLDLFVCGDQIKKGAALNAVQIAEEVAKL